MGALHVSPPATGKSHSFVMLSPHQRHVAGNFCVRRVRHTMVPSGRRAVTACCLVLFVEEVLLARVADARVDRVALLDNEHGVLGLFAGREFLARMKDHGGTLSVGMRHEGKLEC
jgi:hypothetical protein